MQTVGFDLTRVAALCAVGSEHAHMTAAARRVSCSLDQHALQTPPQPERGRHVRLHPRGASWLAVLLWAGCAPGAEPRGADVSQHAAELRELLAFEEQQRASTQFDQLPVASQVTGTDPIRVARLPGSEQYVGLLRGEPALVMLDAQGRELQRLETLPLPSALVISDVGGVFVASAQRAAVARYVASDAGLVAREVFEFSELAAIRDIGLLAPNVLVGIELQTGRLFVVEVEPDAAGSALRAGVLAVSSGCLGANRVIVDSASVVHNCALEHRVDFYPRGLDGMPALEPRTSISLQAPLFGLATARSGTTLLIALGGLEDHPLERSAAGALGYIDSFLYVYRLSAGAERPERVAEQNLSELELVTPKWIAIETDTQDQTLVTLAGYGTPALLRLRYDPTFSLPAQVEARRLAPGIAWVEGSYERGIAADPLLDRWLVYGADDVDAVAPEGSSPEPSALFRFGEALTFTTLIANSARSEGRASRFTCETCHLDGYGDGRTHNTGRDEVRTTTKPIRGLFNNRPHFSRALDPTLTAMVHNEFRVANLEAEGDAWFERPREEVPWLDPQQTPAVLSPEWQRRAMMTFLMGFTHEANPRVLSRSQFSQIERAGALAFATRCERCHRARLSTDAPASRLPFERWEELILRSNGPIVWASEAYEMTGITPYVHPRGTRVPSLRRVELKWPYFTDGSAKTLDDVLQAVRFQGETFGHRVAQDDDAWQPLSEAEREAISAFLRLL